MFNIPDTHHKCVDTCTTQCGHHTCIFFYLCCCFFLACNPYLSSCAGWKAPQTINATCGLPHDCDDNKIWDCATGIFTHITHNIYLKHSTYIHIHRHISRADTRTIRILYDEGIMSKETIQIKNSDRFNFTRFTFLTIH